MGCECETQGWGDLLQPRSPTNPALPLQSPGGFGRGAWKQWPSLPQDVVGLVSGREAFACGVVGIP